MRRYPVLVLSAIVALSSITASQPAQATVTSTCYGNKSLCGNWKADCESGGGVGAQVEYANGKVWAICVK